VNLGNRLFKISLPESLERTRRHRWVEANPPPDAGSRRRPGGPRLGRGEWPGGGDHLRAHQRGVDRGLVSRRKPHRLSESRRHGPGLEALSPELPFQDPLGIGPNPTFNLGDRTSARISRARLSTSFRLIQFERSVGYFNSTLKSFLQPSSGVMRPATTSSAITRMSKLGKSREARSQFGDCNASQIKATCCLLLSDQAQVTSPIGEIGLHKQDGRISVGEPLLQLCAIRQILRAGSHTGMNCRRSG
jgi:hypothetical protein